MNTGNYITETCRHQIKQKPDKNQEMRGIRRRLGPIALFVSLGVNFILLKGIYQNDSPPENSSRTEANNSKALEFIKATEEIRNRFIVKRQKLFPKNISEGNLMWDDKRYVYIWNYFPPTFTCPHLLERIGRADDGGKWVCGIEVFKEQKDCIVYSFGVGGDSSFEREILDRTPCRIWAYDYTVDSMRLGDSPPPSSDLLSRVKFQKLGLSDGKDLFKLEMRTLSSLMRENGHDWIDFLKIDVEGAEFSILGQIREHFDTFPFGHLNLEVHLPLLKEKEEATQKEFFGKMWEWWGQLENAGLRAYLWEDNHVPCASGGRPIAMEYSFVNVKDRRNKLLKF